VGPRDWSAVRASMAPAGRARRMDERRKPVVFLPPTGSSLRGEIETESQVVVLTGKSKMSAYSAATPAHAPRSKHVDRVTQRSRRRGGSIPVPDHMFKHTAAWYRFRRIGNRSAGAGGQSFHGAEGRGIGRQATFLHRESATCRKRLVARFTSGAKTQQMEVRRIESVRRSPRRKIYHDDLRGREKAERRPPCADAPADKQSGRGLS